MNETQTPSHYCRICGSIKLNKFYYAIDLCNKVELHQVLSRDGSLDELIRPCECRGEFAFAHKVCLSNWLETTKHEFCDICRFKYNITLQDRSFFDWIFETRQIKSLLRVISLAVLVYYLASLGIIVCRGHNRKYILDTIVLSSSYIWITVCTLYVLVYCYNGLMKFFEWKSTNRRIAVEANPNPQLDVQTKEKDVLKSSGFKPRDVTMHIALNKKDT